MVSKRGTDQAVNATLTPLDLKMVTLGGHKDGHILKI